MKKKKNKNKILYHFFMIVFCIFMLYPLLWMVSSSFKPSEEVMRTSGQLIPRNPTFQNYIYGWKGFARNTFAVFFKNSFFISIIRVIGTVFSCSITAYAFARIPFKGKKILFAIVVAMMCLPGMVLQLPQYIMFSKLGWVGSWLPILLPSWFATTPFFIFLLIQFMKNVSKQVDEAAKIDGCGWLRLYTEIMLPLIRPALASVAVLTFIEAWGDYYSSLIYLNKTEYYPVAYALKLYSDEVSTNYGPMLAMSVLSLVPIMILFFIFQKSLVEGISTSGIKG